MNVGDKVIHRKEPTAVGEIVEIDPNLIDVTTCKVRWVGSDEVYVEWTNKLVVIN